MRFRRSGSRGQAGSPTGSGTYAPRIFDDGLRICRINDVLTETLGLFFGYVLSESLRLAHLFPALSLHDDQGRGIGRFLDEGEGLFWVEQGDGFRKAVAGDAVAGDDGDAAAAGLAEARARIDDMRVANAADQRVLFRVAGSRDRRVREPQR